MTLVMESVPGIYRVDKRITGTAANGNKSRQGVGGDMGESVVGWKLGCKSIGHVILRSGWFGVGNVSLLPLM